MERVIVTGGLGALGRAVVAELTGLGANVVVVDLAADPGGVGATVFGGIDLADENAVETAFGQAAKILNGVDGLVNVAGGFTWELVEGGEIASWDRMYQMNLRTAAIASNCVLSHMERGAIVNIGAAGATNPASGMAAYAASKAGVMALTESLAEELRSRSIRVNAVLPTILDTPANRRAMPEADTSTWVQPSSAAKVIAFLLSQDAGAVTGTGIRLSLG